MLVHSSHVAAVGQVHHDHVIVVTDRHALAAHEYWPPGGNSVMCMSCFSIGSVFFANVFFNSNDSKHMSTTIPLIGSMLNTFKHPTWSTCTVVIPFPHPFEAVSARLSGSKIPSHGELQRLQGVSCQPSQWLHSRRGRPGQLPHRWFARCRREVSWPWSIEAGHPRWAYTRPQAGWSLKHPETAKNNLKNILKV